MRIRSVFGRGGLVVALMALGQFVLWPSAASAATINVTSTADVATNFGACGNSAQTVPTGTSLREAICAANNAGAASTTINVAAGTYLVTNGELAMGKVAGSNITLTGAGSASTIIDGNHNSRVFDLDPSVVGGVTSSISGVTIQNGRDGTFGGAGLIAGGGHNAQDTLTVSNSVFSNNQANFAAPATSNKPGGGMSFQGGSLNLTNVTFSGNQSFSSAGGGLWYQTFEAGGTLTINGATFSGNSTANSGASGTSGGALALSAGAGGATYNVSDSTFTGNTSSSSGTGETAAGGAIFQTTGNLTLTGSTFTSNSVSGAGATGGPIIYTAGNSTMHYNRFLGNTGTGGVMTNSGTGVANVTENWWGCNTGPGGAGCETVSGTGITSAPRLVLTATASPAHVVHPSTTSTITASLLTDSSGGAVSAANLAPAFAGLPISFADPPGDATVGGSPGAHSVNLAAGVASIGYQAGTVLGPDNVLATLDNGTATAILEVDEPPTISSANIAHFKTGVAGSFTITTTGYPPAAITETGSLPSGLTFHDNGDGSATISGTPGAGTGGNYTLNLTAANGYLPNATQTLTVNVVQPPAFTSGATATFVIGSAGSFGVTTSGFPTVATITESGTLPAGITFTDNGNGTATIAGTPTGNGNTYPVTLTATNGVTPNATQNLTIQVNQPPSITLNPVDQTVQPGTSVSFTAAASGVPTPTVQWQRSTDGGVSFTNIAGATSTTYTFTAALSDNGNQYRAVFSNGIGSPATTTAATLNVGIAPAFTSADHTSFVVGSAGLFNITTSGVPAATLSRTGAQFPAWLTLTDNGDGTGTLTGTPPAGSAGTYQFTLKAANGFTPSASQNFTLFVDDSPVITSADHTTFTAGAAGSFAVTTTAGFPTTTAISETGSLPSGVTFVDNGDGTATLAGTPAAGTGGTYNITITATAVGGLAAPATQSFTLTVQAPPIITSANHATFSEGSAGSFTVTTTAGNPATTTITSTGNLPTGVSFTDNGDGTATIAGTPSLGSQGIYTITITASNGVTPDATQSFTLTVNAPPAITSVDHATFTVNAAAAFTVTTTGTPTPSLSETGSLPPGMTFTDNGDGTATLGGTPTSGGSFSFTITASNGVLPNATQSFTATVNASPSITSADHTTFAVGSAGTFTVTTTPGVPATTTITESGSLPSGVSFTDNGDGTATLAGTPAAGTGGSYPLTFTASNGVLPNSMQTFTLTVTELPAITSADHTTFQVGSAGTFTVTTTAGFPAATTVTEVGALPSGVTFTDNGDGSATLAGTPAAGTGGSYPLTITATNTAGHVDQAFTLTVTASALITSADHTTFAVGSAGTFTVTTAPSATTITETGALPSGVSFTDNGDGTATLAGTPAAGSGGSYSITITASNGIPPNATQAFTLTVTELPAITSANHTTFAVGSAGTFTVTTHAGFPTATTLTEVGSLPSGVTFTDNGDGTATLAGTPAAGTGGSYPLTLTATNTAGHTDQAFTLTVTDSPVITSADHTTFAVGSAGTFTVTTTPGVPAATTLTETGALPSGVTFHDNGNGTATLAGTPAAGTGGSYSLTITASNGVPPNSTQAFTLTVTEVPGITSANHTTFIVGSAGTFTVTTHAGFPTATTLTETGTLPSGVTFTDNGDGTATLAGTPAAGTGGTYSLTFTATNTVGHTSQAFTLTVGASPTITSADHTTFTVNHAGTFTVTTTGGFPTPPALSKTGSLPAGVTFHDNGNGTATLSGTPTVGGTFVITITANNGVAPVTTQTFTLTVNGPPVFTSGNTFTFVNSKCGTYLITTTSAGSPGTTHITESGALPAGVTFHDNGDGTATLSGCVNGITSKRSFSVTFTATNSVGHVTQSATVLVVPPGAVSLPKNLPSSNGTLGGVPASTTRGQVLHLSGDGFAPGAPITIGYYPGPVTLTNNTFKVFASSTGSFTADITVTVTGNLTYVAAGTGSNGNSRFLEAATHSVMAAAVSGGGSLQTSSGGDQLAFTGTSDLRSVARYSLAAVLAGLVLMMVSRRRREEH
ncbi:MAG TPA: putative Ig domain-containing protein [Jatrophihabitans sp.]|nr:putative Ig domain-containing protein [Jatrophihabitans sp.]